MGLHVHVHTVAGEIPNPLRSLFWGLLGFTILMSFVAWADIGELFVPPSTGPGVRLVDMPAPLLALNLALCALPVVAFVLILAGVAGMLRWTPGLLSTLSWRVGKLRFTPLRFAAILVLSWSLFFIAVVVFALLEILGTSVNPAIVLGGGLTVSLLPIAIGWYFMVMSGWVLSPGATRWERIAIRIAVISAGFLAALLIAARVAATFAMGSFALDPGARIPPLVPWADVPAGVGGFGSLVVLTTVAKRAAARGSPVPAPEKSLQFTTREKGSEDKAEFVCSECGRDVSQEDKACPHCGALIEG